MTRIVAVTNQKGGCGKTTLALLLAGTLGRRGRSVLLIDADAQGTATHATAAAPEDRPFPAAVSGLAAAGERIHREIRKHVGVYDVIVVDCPPAVDSVTPQSALLVADLALIPVLPSPADLWATLGTLKLLEHVGAVNEGLRARLVLNGVQANARIARAVEQRLAELGVPLLAARLAQRTVYRQAMALGSLPHELGSEGRAAAAETDLFVDEVASLLALDPPPAPPTRRRKASAPA